MLSDEEKKAIEYLKIEYEKLMKEDNILFPLYKSNAKRLIDIIEKQSKEIEELKEIYQTGYVNGCVSKVYEINKKWKDKIKAKIEELQEDIKYSANPLSIDNSKFGIKVLESLLEKEEIRK